MFWGYKTYRTMIRLCDSIGHLVSVSMSAVKCGISSLSHTYRTLVPPRRQSSRHLQIQIAWRELGELIERFCKVTLSTQAVNWRRSDKRLMNSKDSEFAWLRMFCSNLRSFSRTEERSLNPKALTTSFMQLRLFIACWKTCSDNIDRTPVLHTIFKQYSTYDVENASFSIDFPYMISFWVAFVLNLHMATCRGVIPYLSMVSISQRLFIKKSIISMWLPTMA